MIEIEDVLSGNCDNFVRKYKAYYPKKKTCREHPDHDFDNDVEETLLELGYEFINSSSEYTYKGKKCIDDLWMHPIHKTDIRVTRYYLPKNVTGVPSYVHVTVDGKGRHARMILEQLNTKENSL